MFNRGKIVLAYKLSPKCDFVAALKPQKNQEMS